VSTLARLAAQFERDAELTEVFVVLTLASTLIASFGLLANSASVVIGAMVVAPWILPLQAIAFGVLQGRSRLVLRALLTLVAGVTLAMALSLLIGRLSGFPAYGSEVLARTTPNLLDLGVALVAGALAMYARLRRQAISALAGLAIAVALVPPVCSLGLTLALADLPRASGAGLLFATNLLGILSGALLSLGLLEPSFRLSFWSNRLGLISLGFTLLLLVPLSGSFVRLLQDSRREQAALELERAIAASLRSRTITLGQESRLVDLKIDWKQNPPLIMATVRSTDPSLPSAEQVAAVQQFINDTQPIRYRLVVERSIFAVVGPQTAPNPPSVEIPAPSPPLPPPPLPPVTPSPADQGAPTPPSG